MNTPPSPRWERVEFRTLLREPLRNGHSAKASTNGKGIRALTLTAVTQGDFSEKNTKLTVATQAKADGLWLEPGDVLIERSNTPQLVGTAAVYRGPRNFAIFPDLVIRARLLPSVSDKYIGFFLASESARTHFQRAAQGIAGSMPKISQDVIERLQVPLPPRTVQDRVVEEVEKQFTRLDAGVEALKRLQAHLRRYRAAVLKEATSGWDAVPLKDLLREPLANGKSVKGSDSPPGVPALRLNAMGDSGFDYAKVRYLPLDWKAVEDIAVKEGDFFVSRGNGSLHLVGRGTLAQSPPVNVVFPDTMIRVRLRAELGEAGWLPAIWASRAIRSQVEAKAKTTAGIWKISQADLEGILVPLPPLTEQERLVATISALMSQAANADAVVERSLIRAQRLRSAILRSAFNGTLPT